LSLLDIDYLLGVSGAFHVRGVFQVEGPQRPDFFGEFVHDLGVPGAFGRADEFHSNALRVDTELLQYLLQKRGPPHRLVITFLVMAVAGVSTADQDAVGPLLEGFEDELGVDAPGAHDPYRD
jgi:hypothetical protein